MCRIMYVAKRVPPVVLLGRRFKVFFPFIAKVKIRDKKGTRTKISSKVNT